MANRKVVNFKPIALFIPCFNEADRLRVEPIKNFINDHKAIIDFYFIDDGSEDGTEELIRWKLVDNHSSFLIKLDRNFGKGNALREGFLKIKEQPYKYFGFIDADLDIPLKQVIEVYNQLEISGSLIGISSRDLRNALKLTQLRSIGSIAIVNIANKIIGLQPGIKDTQCGCKLFRREILDICFADKFISEWLFDIELFLRIKENIKNARDSIMEIPLYGLEKNGKSNFRLRQNLKIFRQLYLIKIHYR